MLAQENSDKEFIELYLKIQNLEKEIATLRNEIEVIQTQLDFYQEKNIQKINEIDSKLISLMSIEDLQKSEAIVVRDDQVLNSYDQAILLIRKGQLNEALSERRAKAVEDFLTATGVSSFNIEVVGYGEEMPVDNSSNETAWSKNRRAELFLNK